MCASLGRRRTKTLPTGFCMMHARANAWVTLEKAKIKVSASHADFVSHFQSLGSVDRKENAHKK